MSSEPDSDEPIPYAVWAAPVGAPPPTADQHPSRLEGWQLIGETDPLTDAEWVAYSEALDIDPGCR